MLSGVVEHSGPFYRRVYHFVVIFPELKIVSKVQVMTSFCIPVYIHVYSLGMSPNQLELT